MARKKKRSQFGYIIKIFFLIWIACVTVYYIISYFIRSPDIFYPGYAIEIPVGYEIHGIDVSKYQSIINWKLVKDMNVKNVKIDFAFIKATEGTGNIDNEFRRNWLKAEEQNIFKGAYHFFIAGKNGKKQADNFIEIVNLKKGDLPPVLDIEETYGVAVVEIKKEIKEWLETVKQYYGVYPIIYTNINFYNTYLQNDFDEYPLWIANYLQPKKPNIAHTWIFWQHNKSGRVNGINGFVDFNVFSGDSTDFKNLLIQ